MLVNPARQVYVIRVSREINWNLKSSSWQSTVTADCTAFATSSVLHTTAMHDSSAQGSKPSSSNDRLLGHHIILPRPSHARPAQGMERLQAFVWPNAYPAYVQAPLPHVCRIREHTPLCWRNTKHQSDEKPTTLQNPYHLAYSFQ